MQLELGELDLRYASLRIIDRSRQRRLVASVLEHGQLTPVLSARRVELGLARRLRQRRRADRARARPRRRRGARGGRGRGAVLAHGLDNGRERTALEEEWLLRELCDRHGLAHAELARRLDRTRSWVSRQLALVGALPEAVQESVRAAEVSVQVATKILVPLARANGERAPDDPTV